ncbi:DNA photolyase [Scenedesmus sp. NREL 46B-D3]|nr:DNA photolyase [Scenedesmus sp. NREL 46B-D3]
MQVLLPSLATCLLTAALIPQLPKRVTGGNSGPPGMPAGRKPALLWFRNDLRLHDHEPLAAACAGATSLLPVYVFDPREFGKSPNGFDKTGPYRAKFVLEALGDLRAKLRAAGSDLLVRTGKPEDVLPELVRSIGAGSVYCHGEVTAEDAKVEGAVSKALDKAGAALKVFWGGTLFHVDDLPFKLATMPPNYSDFRQALSGRDVRQPVEPPAQLKGLPAASVCPGELPTLRQLGFDAATLSRCAGDKDAAGAHLRGGETEALQRLSEFVARFRGQQQQHQQHGNQEAAAPNFCCKISPWLALGCLSPRQLYVQLQQTAGAAVASAKQPALLPVLLCGTADGPAGMQWLLFELLWRDFFRFITKKYTVTGMAQRLGTSSSIKEVPATAAPAMAMA